MLYIISAAQRQKQSGGAEGWTYCGVNISYTQETESTEANNRQKNNRSATYVLTFTVTFTEADDVCYFAYCQPYTFTDLQHFLQEKALEHETSGILHSAVLCHSLAGNPCDLLTISSNVDALAAAELSLRDDSPGLAEDESLPADLMSSVEDTGRRGGTGDADACIPPGTGPMPPPAANIATSGPPRDRFNIGLFQEKVHVLVTARVHPGETSGSWMVQVR